MWAAAGNLWISANQAGKAALDLDRALSMPGLEAEQRGEALLDRARAAEAQDDLQDRARQGQRSGRRRSPTIRSTGIFRPRSRSARTIREPRKSAINKALSMAPNDPTILFEAGHVAHFTGDDDKARSYWMRAAGSDPNGATGKAAAKAVEMLGVTPDGEAGPSTAAEVTPSRR